MKALVALLGGAALLASGIPARAHEVRPAYLELQETAPGSFAVTWKVPARANQRLDLQVRFPENWRALTPRVAEPSGAAVVERWTVQAEPSGAGGVVQVAGLAGTQTDVLVRVVHAGGAPQVLRLTPAQPRFTLAAPADGGGVAGTYFWLGVEHILGAADHLLFILSLLLLVHGWRRVVATLTAFTLAHSITLALAALGVLQVPAAPVEVAIAGSIAVVAAEVLRHPRPLAPGLVQRWPWGVAFCLGLLHGLGFAGALHQVGLPAHAIPAALVFFNAGVEAGQLVFVAAVLGMVSWAARVPERLRRHLPRLRLAAAYGMGSVACTWVLERTLGLAGPGG